MSRSGMWQDGAFRLRAAVFVMLVLPVLGVPRAGRAGDAAELKLLGASAGGRYVAYMQSGARDGSGSPYAWVDFFDVTHDRPVSGAKPIRVGGREGDTLSLARTERQARSKAQATLQKLGIAAAHAGRVLLSHPLTDLGVDSLEARLSVSKQLAGLGSQDLRLTLTPLPMAGGRCYSDERLLGLAATLRDMQSGAEVTLHRDSSLTAADGCPIAYRIGEVRLPGAEPANGKVTGRPVLVLVQVFSTGFEGHDMRWKPIGGRLP